MRVKNPSTVLSTGIIPGQHVTKAKLQRAKELRHEMTPAEKVLWQELRANNPVCPAWRDTLLAHSQGVPQILQ